MPFLFQNKPINLDLAAKILIGDPSIDQTENAKFKSKKECQLRLISI